MTRLRLAEASQLPGGQRWDLTSKLRTGLCPSVPTRDRTFWEAKVLVTPASSKRERDGLGKEAGSDGSQTWGSWEEEGVLLHHVELWLLRASPRPAPTPSFLGPSPASEAGP